MLTREFATCKIQIKQFRQTRGRVLTWWVHPIGNMQINGLIPRGSKETCKIGPSKRKHSEPGADLRFSWGGGGGQISKKNSKILSTFFLGRPHLLFELSQSTKKSLFWPHFLCRRQSFEKTGQKRRFYALFGKFWPKNRVFSARASPSKLVYFSAEDAFKFF